MKCCDFQKLQCPVVKKCCFCVPIRKGVIIFGYVNLVLSLLSFPFLLFLLVEGITTVSRETDNQEVSQETAPIDPVLHIPLTIAFVATDVIITIILLVGAHQKKRILLQIYFYFGTLFQILTLCVDLIYFDFREYMENIIYFIFFGLNIYLLFLVYNTMQVVQESREVQYVTYRRPLTLHLLSLCTSPFNAEMETKGLSGKHGDLLTVVANRVFSYQEVPPLI